MKEISTTGGYTQNDLDWYLAASRKLDEAKIEIRDKLSLLRIVEGASAISWPVRFKVGIIVDGNPCAIEVNTDRQTRWLDFSIAEKFDGGYTWKFPRDSNGQYVTHSMPERFVMIFLRALPKIFTLIGASEPALKHRLEQRVCHAEV